MKKGVKWAVVIVVAALVGVGGYFGFQEWRYAPAKGALRAWAKDPGSLQFRSLHYVASTQAVCGEFNAKNSYGAYTGFAMFAFDASGKLLLMPVENPAPRAPTQAEMEAMSPVALDMALEKAYERKAELAALTATYKVIDDACRISEP